MKREINTFSTKFLSSEQIPYVVLSNQSFPVQGKLVLLWLAKKHRTLVCSFWGYFWVERFRWFEDKLRLEKFSSTFWHSRKIRNRYNEIDLELFGTRKAESEVKVWLRRIFVSKLKREKKELDLESLSERRELTRKATEEIWNRRRVTSVKRQREALVAPVESRLWTRCRFMPQIGQQHVPSWLAARANRRTVHLNNNRRFIMTDSGECFFRVPLTMFYYGAILCSSCWNFSKNIIWSPTLQLLYQFFSHLFLITSST